MVHEAQSANEQNEYIEHRNPAAPVEVCQRTLGTLFLNSCIHTYFAVFISSFFFFSSSALQYCWGFPVTASLNPQACLMMESIQARSAPCSLQFISKCVVSLCYWRVYFFHQTVIKLHWSFYFSSIKEQAKAKKQTPPPSPTTQPAEQKAPSSPVYEVC